MYDTFRHNLLWIASYWPVSDLQLVLKLWLSVLTGFCGVLYADHVRFDPRQLTIARASTDALIFSKPL